MPIRTRLQKHRFAVCFQISITTHVLKIMLSNIVLRIWPIYDDMFRVEHHRWSI